MCKNKNTSFHNFTLQKFTTCFYFFNQKMTETYFIIKNDVTGMYKINEDDPQDIKISKYIGQMREFATFDQDTKTWRMQLPKWFCESEFENKALILESFYYYKPDGTMDLGTSLHCPLLCDGQFSQHDNMICMANDGVERIFYIDGRINEIEFWFKDYLSNENLNDHEEFYEQKTNDKGQPLYYLKIDSTAKVSFIPKYKKPMNENDFPVLVPLKDETEGSYYYIYTDLATNEPQLTKVKSSKGIENGIFKYPVLLQNQPVWYEISELADYEQTIEVTDFPVMEPYKIGDKLVYLGLGDILKVLSPEQTPEKTDALIYSYVYDDEGNQIYWKIWDAEYINEDEEFQEGFGKLPILTSIENEEEQTMYLEKIGPDWFETIKKTDQILYIPKPCWNTDDITKVRYYKFREGITHRKTTEETELPVYSPAKDGQDNMYYADIDIEDNKVIFRNMTTYQGSMGYHVPVYVHEKNDAGQKLYWQTLGETTVDTGDAILVEKSYEASFVMVCRLRC